MVEKMKQKILLLMFFVVSGAFSQPADTLLVLEDVIREAVENNPGLKAEKDRWKAAASAVDPAGALPDPVLGFNVLNLPADNFVFDQEPMTGKQLVLRQKIPFPGKLSSERKIAQESSNLRRQQFLEQRNQFIKSVKIAYYNLNYIDTTIATIQKNADLLQQFASISRIRYETGRGIQQDYLQAELELARNQEKLIAWRQKRQATAARLNQLMNRPVRQAVPKTQPLEIAPVDFSLADLMESAKKRRPQSAAWEAMVRRADEKVSRARKNFLPDLTLGVAWTQRDVLKNGAGGVDYLSGMLSINLPLYFWQKQKPNVQANEQTAVRVKSQRENYLRELAAEIEIRLSELQQHQKLKALYESQMLPRARQNLASARSAYQVSKVDFQTLLNSQMLLLNYQLDYHRVQKEIGVSLAKLEALVGGSLK